jgi:hypothetical protein
MSLQKINLTQIDTVPTSGTSIVFGSFESPISEIFVEEMNISGSLEIGGNLIVRGETTIVESTIIQIDDNILELNGSGESFGGIIVKDVNSPSMASGSLLWDSINNRWVAGTLGSEKQLIYGDGTEYSIQRIDSSGSLTNSRIYDNTQTIILSGSTIIKGDLLVEGTTRLVQTQNPTDESLIVLGAMKIMENVINSQIISSSIEISGLGTLSSRNSQNEIDLGGLF